MQFIDVGVLPSVRSPGFWVQETKNGESVRKRQSEQKKQYLLSGSNSELQLRACRALPSAPNEWSFHNPGSNRFALGFNHDAVFFFFFLSFLFFRHQPLARDFHAAGRWYIDKISSTWWMSCHLIYKSSVCPTCLCCLHANPVFPVNFGEKIKIVNSITSYRPRGGS